MASDSPWLLVGLGNPGSRYANNRHNVGFMVVDAWAEEQGATTDAWREKFNAHLASVSSSRGGGRVHVLKPQTFMNRSGKSVQAAATFFQVPPQRIIVVHDELDFEFGRVAIKSGGGHGGHNGLRDIVALLGADFARVRVGIGRPTRGDVTGWVLTDFSGQDAVELPEIVARARVAVTKIVELGVQAAMNDFNAANPGNSPASKGRKGAASPGDT